MAVPINIVTLGALFIAAPLFCLGQTIDCGSATDQYFTGGIAYAVQTPGATGDLTLRYGAFSYNIPTSPGNYTVSLFMRETGTPGKRQFSVSINGTPRLQGFDLFGVAGLAEFRRDFTAASSSGFINIVFTYTLKSAVVSRIVVTAISPMQVIVPGFGMVLDLYAANAVEQKLGINAAVTMHRVAVPVAGSPCNIAGQMAIDADAQYYCISNQGITSPDLSWGHWVAFPRVAQ